MNIYPAILSDDPSVVQDQLAMAADMQQAAAQVAHIDIIDGLFVDNLTITPSDLVGLDPGDDELDFHLMVEEPLDLVHELMDIADQLPIRAVIAQVERMSSEKDFCQSVRQQGWKIGLSLNLDTEVEAIDDDIWSYLDIVQVMGVMAGEQQQQFAERSLEVVKAVGYERQLRGLEFEIIVDGGINESNLIAVKAAGASGAAVGSAIWKSPNPIAAFDGLAALIR